MATHPRWATKFRLPGTELRLINNKYYLYEVTSKWDPDKKRAKKISGKLLGRITKEDGFIESDKARLRKKEFAVSQLSVKEYGIVNFIDSCFGNYLTLIEKYFPDCWREIVTLAYCKLAYQSPMKNVEFHYFHSYLSEKFPKLQLTPKNITDLLRLIGGQRTRITDFFKEFGVPNDNILFDGTDLISNSRKMDITKYGKSKKGTYDSMANIMFIFSVKEQLPVYYRIMPGNIKDVKAFKLCLAESHLKDAVIIADKGFYSEENIDLLRKEKLHFIVPLKRNSSLINYNKMQYGSKQKFDGFFKFENRIIWYYKTKAGKENIYTYLDDELKAEEIRDYLVRVESLPEDYNMDNFYTHQYRFGTISLLNNLQKTPEQVFEDYKSRSQIETMIDALKNVIDADKSYMQNEQALEAWMFINYIVLHWYYKILQLLKSKELNSRYSPMDIIQFLKEVRKVKINDNWYNAEITRKSKDLLELIGVHIT
jgi:transposase